MSHAPERPTSRVDTKLALWLCNPDIETGRSYKVRDVVPLYGAMYPGIKFLAPDAEIVAFRHACPDLIKAYPLLVEFKNAAEAVAVLGPDIEVPVIRPCDGYAWEKWPESPALT